MQRRIALPVDRDRRGFTLFEFAIALTVSSILVAVLLDRLGVVQELAEKTAMENVARDVQSAIRLTVAQAMVEERWERVARLRQSNPMDLLERRPGNYRGTLSDSVRRGVEPGAWYFDDTRVELVYVPNWRQHPGSGSEGSAPRIRYRVTVLPERAGLDGRRTIYWARLELVEPHQWQVR